MDPISAEIAATGLLGSSDSVVVLVSGGADSACAAAGLVGLLGASQVHVLHLDYRLRENSGDDRSTCAELCRLLGVELTVELPALAEGNVQAAARAARYAAAEILRERVGADWIATGHTRTDLAETVIYRLASSPGRRALLGLAPRRGRIVRPLLGVSRERARELAETAGLPFRDDPTNAEPLYARNRIRNEVLPVLGELAPAPEQTIAATWAELAEEADALEAVAEEALAAMGAGPGAIAASGASIAELHPALSRLALRRLAERAAGRPVALGAERSAEILRLAHNPEGGTLELGGGVEAHVEHGHIRFIAVARVVGPRSARLRVPGTASFGEWELRAELVKTPPPPAGPELAALDPEALGGELVVRTWRDGDRMRPLGLGGSKSLQDLFTDAKVPRSLRRSLPVVVAAGDRIAWVAGVAVSEEFRLSEGAQRIALLSARAVS
ncbi:MAG: tRNA lysidine(34) synthetase TilS [Solirubrobacterales bacterium]